MSLFVELKRRNVFRVAIAYIVMAWLVMQVTDVILNNISAPSWVFQTILLLLGIGFLVAMFFAWAFELTPEGLKREHEVDRSQSITPQTGQKLNKLIFTLMGLAIAYFAYDKFVLGVSRDAALVEATTQAVTEQAAAEAAEVPVPEETATEIDRSIAVLPFADMSPNRDQEYFSDGLSEELLNLLVKVPDLKVAARTSSFSFKGQNLEIPEIAERLKVAHVLEGSVRTAGNRVRITAQLIQASDGYHLWSETYDRELENIFAIQDEISAAVVEQLKITLLGEAPHAAKVDPEAYALFLRARHLRRLRTVEGWEQSIELTKQALAIEPEYTEAWINLSANYASQAGAGIVPYGEGYQQAKDAVQEAFAINPFSARAHDMLGWITFNYDRNLPQAAQHYQRALQLEPSNIDIIGNSASLMMSLDRLDQSIALYQYTTIADPLNQVSLANLGHAYLLVGRYPEAIDSMREALSLSPGYYAAHYFIGQALLLQGEAEAALGEFALEESDEQYRVKGQALALYQLGRSEDFEAKLQELITRWGDRWPSEVAHVYAYIGDAETAFQWLERSVVEEEGNFDWQEPLLVSLHDDPRWWPMVRRAGHPGPEELAAVEFEVKLPKQ
jgi:adenylate cyclase